jgi:hypothetical protein
MVRRLLPDKDHRDSRRFETLVTVIAIALVTGVLVLTLAYVLLS